MRTRLKRLGVYVHVYVHIPDEKITVYNLKLTHV